MKLQQLIPAFEWLPKYNSTQFKGDLGAGLTVGVMLIPQGMAYALLAGLPPIYGLYASTLPLILYAFLGTSRQLAVGPVAMVSLLTASGVGMMAEGGTELYLALAIGLAILVGLIQLFLGLFRLGFLVNFLSHPVISGFTSAAALIIGFSQLKHLMGIDLERSHHVHEIILQAINEIDQLNWPTFAIGIGAIALILGLRRINRKLPAPLFAVIAGILVTWGVGLTEQGVKIVGDIPQGLPAIGLPQLDMANYQALLPIALTISLVSFMESIAVAKAIQAKHKSYRVVPNQELIALGVANLGGALVQSYPVTGGFSRTAVNDQAGARTGMASVISALLIIITLLFLTPVFYYLPNAILASVIMVAVFGLIDIREPIYLWKTDRSDFVMLLVTFLATLLLGIEQGIGIGVILSLAVMVYRSSKPHLAVLGKLPGTTLYRNVDRFEGLEVRDDLLVIRFDALLYFANVQYFQDRIEELVDDKGSKLQTMIINCEGIQSVDSSALHMLTDFLTHYELRELRVVFTGLIGPVRDALSRTGLLQRIGMDNIYMTVQQAVDAVDEKTPIPQSEEDRLASYRLQSNT